MSGRQAPDQGKGALGPTRQYRSLSQPHRLLDLRTQAQLHARQAQAPEALEHEGVLDKMQARLDRLSDAMTIRRQTVEHPFGTLKAWMGSTHFLTRTLEKVSTEMSLQVLAYNMKRMINIFGVKPLMQTIAA